MMFFAWKTEPVHTECKYLTAFLENPKPFVNCCVINQPVKLHHFKLFSKCVSVKNSSHFFCDVEPVLLTPFSLSKRMCVFVCVFSAECTRESGVWWEGQSSAAADGAGRQRAGSEGLCQTVSDPTGEEEAGGAVHVWDSIVSNIFFKGKIFKLVIFYILLLKIKTLKNS